MAVAFLLVLVAMACLSGAAAHSMDAGSAEPVGERGFYRMLVGDFTVIALSDGHNRRSVEQQLELLHGDREKLRDVLMRAYPSGQLESTVNVYLIDTGSRRVLVDAGNGSMGSPTMGNVLGNLRAAGYQPEQIDEIYLTHMHVDHVGGLLAGSEPAFPNATVVANQREADYWLDESKLAAAPAATQRTFQAARTALAPYITAGRFRTFEGDKALAPGISAVAMFGHTPGHTGYAVESNGKTLVLWGDIIHVAAVQFDDPAVTLAFDSDEAAAAKTRRQIMATAASHQWLVGGVHLAFPGLGELRSKADGGYGFAPLDLPAPAPVKP